MLVRATAIVLTVGLIVFNIPWSQVSRVFGGDKGSGAPQTFPQVFNLGSDTTSDVTVFNPNGKSGTYDVQFISQDGSFLMKQSTIPSLGTGQFTPPPDFLGSAVVSGSQTFNSIVTWQLTVLGNSSNVGVPPLHSDGGFLWTGGVGELSSGSMIGVAIHNT